MVLKRPSTGYQLALALISVMMVSVVLDSMAEFWRMTPPGSHLLLMSLGAIAYGWLWWRSPWLGGGVTLAAAVGSLVALRYSDTYVLWLSQVVREGLELYEQLRAAELGTTFGSQIGLALLGLTAVLAGLLITWEGFGRGSAFWSIVGGVFLFGTQWAWFFDKSASFFMGFLVLALLLWTVSQSAHRDAYWQSSGRRIGYKSHVATPLVAVFAASIAGAIMPTEFAPLHLGQIGVKVQEAFPVLKQLRGGGAGSVGGRFSLAVTGFSPTMGTLGGPVQLDEKVALYLGADRPLTETIYLRGATFLTYTGRSWEAGESQQVSIPTDGTLPTSYAPDVLREYLTVRVTPALSFGRTIFNVLEPMRVEDLKSEYEADADGNLFAERSIARNTTYKVTARLPLYSAEQVRLLSSFAPEQYYENYLQLPENLPRRVRDMTRSIARTAEHPYDKAVAIESYLRSMQYELNAPEAPAGRDFVDFFLFDLREGYCVYYATAMTVMLRDLGIPSRLVEGFAVPASAEYTEDAKGARTYSVLNSQAHAWVEAYFPGYGWVTFDPTPRADLPVIGRDTPAPDPSAIQPTSPTNETPEDPGNLNPQDLADPNALEGGNAIGPVTTREWPWFLTPLLIMLALGAAAYQYLSRQDRLASTEGRGLVQEVWEKSAGLLARFDFGRAPHQTAREYAATLGEAFPILKEPAEQVADDYTVARYGPDTERVDPEAGERARSFWQKAHEELFSRYGWRTYLYRRLRWVRKKK
ncbi:MAG: transglutaminase TgpA family protein [Bacillota bacterium]